jgi:alpha-tubulin suppressor-like RCC1 family protein
VADQCLPTICTPDKMACDQTFLTLCDATGTSWLKGQNCKDLNQICSGGQCMLPVCTPGVMQCVQGDMATCMADGSGWFPSPCPADTACVNAQCLPKICPPNATECQTGKLATCNATGTAWVQSACAANQACTGGQCLNKICTPSAVQCQSGAVATCDATGTAWVVTDNCPANKAICVSNKCVPVICTAGAIECQSGKAATCSANGTAWTQVSCDDGNTCTADSCLAGKCQNPNAIDDTPCGTGGSCKAGTCVMPFAPGIELSQYSSCVLTPTGAMQCWGDNYYGELGIGASGNRSTPTTVWGLSSGVVAIGGGGSTHCAVLTSGAVKCWGFNANGQVGDNSTVNRSVPTQVIGVESGAIGVSVGAYGSCALLATGGVKCWGANTNGGVGDGTKTARYTATQVTGLTTGVTAIAAGANHACALIAGGVKCWGSNGTGSVGDGSGVDRTVPTAVTGLAAGVTAIAAGSNHTCAVLKTGALSCWGSNASGQIGDKSTTNRLAPVQVIAAGVASASGGVDNTCAVLTSGAAHCWGYNYWGQVGDGTTTDRDKPTQVSGLSSGVAMVAVGQSHACAWLTNGKAMCWGDNTYNAVGDATNTWRPTPVYVKGYGG